MEPQTKETTANEIVTTRSSGIRYGLIGGVISIFYSLGLFVSGVNFSEGMWRWAGYIIPLVVIVLAHNYYKKNGDGFMNYGEGISISFWSGLVSAAISTVFGYIYMQFVDPGILDMLKQMQEEQMAQRGMSDEQIEQTMKMVSAFMKPGTIAVMGLIFGILGSVVIGLIVSIFTQKSRPEVI